MSITLWDLKVICGLPVQGEPVDEYLPSNDAFEDMDLAGRVWRIWGRLGKKNPTQPQWCKLFKRISTPLDKKTAPLAALDPSVDPWLPDEELGQIRADEELCLFLMQWLSMTVFPSSRLSGRVRNSLIVAACRLASGERLALAPRVLCEIYRGLNQMASSESCPLQKSVSFPAHYLMAWLGSYFPWTFEANNKKEFPLDIPLRRFSNGKMAMLKFEKVVDPSSSTLLRTCTGFLAVIHGKPEA